jgi:peptidoglycan/LPS O-acetylase OafA/YrhL
MYKINGVLWSIAIEVQLYLIFPLLVASVFRIGRVPTFVLSAVVAAGVIAWAPNAPKLYSWFLPLFVLGMLSAHFAYRPNLRTGTQPILGAAISVLGAALAGYGCVNGWQLYQTDSMIGLAVAALCYALTTSEEGFVCKAFSWRPIVALGAFSYSLYLMHHPIEQVVYAHRPPGIQGETAVFWYLVIVGLPLMISGTWLFSLVCERPFLSKPKPVPGDIKGLTPVSLPLRTLVVTPRNHRPRSIPAEDSERRTVRQSA